MDRRNKISYHQRESTCLIGSEAYKLSSMGNPRRRKRRACSFASRNSTIVSASSRRQTSRECPFPAYLGPHRRGGDLNRFSFLAPRIRVKVAPEPSDLGQILRSA